MATEVHAFFELVTNESHIQYDNHHTHTHTQVTAQAVQT